MRRSTLKLLLLFAVLLASSCKHKTPDRNTEKRISALEERVHQLEDLVYHCKDQTLPDDKDNSRSSYNRCLALTKKGFRCKRMIKLGRYCTQHQR